MSATLFLIGTPIGNLSDLTPRTKQAIEECSLLLVEDTRVTIKLLNHLGLKKKMLSCHDFNERNREDTLRQFASLGQNLALISDAGMPLVSDPGNFIVKIAIELEMNIVAIPGPSAFLLALVASGLATHRFVFEGFLPEKSGDLRKRLAFLKSDERTIVFYISPHKLLKQLGAILEIFGDRRACLAREITKKHEEYIRDSLSNLFARANSEEVRGECVLVIEGAKNNIPFHSTEDIEKLASECLKLGMSVKDTAHELSEKLDLAKSGIYKRVLSVSQRLTGTPDSVD
jgi:16S rRNA (cytidine1402-2'-O)-methyltransferase